MKVNPLCHVEISARDARKTAEFYKILFGWEISFDMGEEYIFFKDGSGIGGAISQNPEMKTGNNIVNYIQVDDIEAYLKKTAELGGKVSVPKTEIPSHGWYGHGVDIDGNIIGLFSPK